MGYKVFKENSQLFSCFIMKFPKGVEGQNKETGALQTRVNSPVYMYQDSQAILLNPFWFFYYNRLEEPNGVITDGDGQYASPSKCFWLIESQR